MTGTGSSNGSRTSAVSVPGLALIGLVPTLDNSISLLSLEHTFQQINLPEHYHVAVHVSSSRHALRTEMAP